MSSTIWTQCAGKSNLKTLACTVYRIVEDQYKITTRQLVDSPEEQERLEFLLESAKPPVPTGPEWRGLSYLLFTPFRYPPLSHGSRFGTSHERGIWYGSETVETTLCEVAFWRLRFLNRTAAVITSDVSFTSFSVPLRSSRAADLTVKPFDRYRQRISSPITYGDSQPLGEAMRADGVEFCRYYSARDPKHGINTGVFSPTAFAAKRISNSSEEHWHCRSTRTEVEFHRRALTQTQSLRFARIIFEVNGKLPLMGEKN